jgi:type VI secretion system secreted protein VgrG
MPAADGGFQNHASQAGTDTNSPTAHTEHRNLYAGLLDGFYDKEEHE